MKAELLTPSILKNSGSNFFLNFGMEFLALKDEILIVKFILLKISFFLLQNINIKHTHCQLYHATTPLSFLQMG